LPVGFHHRCQHLLAGIHTQAVKGVLHVAQHTFDVQRQLHRRGRYYPQRGLRARLHFGGSFLCLLGTWMFASRQKEPPPSAHRFNKFWDIAR
jgi:hypothetical protein